MAEHDPFELRKYYRYLRVVDVVDAMDGVGYFNLSGTIQKPVKS